MTARRVFIILMLASSSALCCHNPADSSQARGNKSVIAYAITAPDGSAQIYTINSDGSGKTALTNEANRVYGPAYAPDARGIAFYAHFNDQAWSLYLMNSDGTDVRRLTSTANVLDWSPDWSPDGNQILFARSFASPVWRSEIWVINPGGSNLHRLGNLDGQGPDWSPDGRKIAFQSKRDGNQEIYVMNTDGSDLVRLTKNSADDEDPNWSPDGTMIAFISMRDGHYEIYIMNANGSNQTRLTTTNGHAIDPDWKPVTK